MIDGVVARDPVLSLGTTIQTSTLAWIRIARSGPVPGYALARLDVTVGARKGAGSAMERDQDLGIGTRERPRGGDGPRVVASRLRALDRMCAAVDAGRSGAILITGEPGAGKTWLAGRLAGLLPAAWRRAHVDLTSALSALDLLHLIGHSLDVPAAPGIGLARARLHSVLHDEFADGRRWLLVIDEAHRALPIVWEELQVIVNQLGRRGGFGALVVIGDTELARLLATRDLGGFASSLSDHVHLLPLDLDEARELLEVPRRGGDRGELALEELHRDARGNPRALLRLAERLPQSWRNPADDVNRQALGQDSYTARSQGAIAPTAQGPVVASREVRARSQSPSLLPSRPPIRIEEGLVEVGWDGDLETELGPAETTESRSQSVLTGDPPPNEEPIEDRYAELQAWTEWSNSQERVALPSDASQVALPTDHTDEPSPGSDAPPVEPPRESRRPSPATAPPGVRAEPQQEFAPYSQLFTRLRQSKQP
jgi:type II secretory pathway predicted ATPase ExeA